MTVLRGPEIEEKTDLPPPRKYSSVEIVMRRAMSPPDGDPANWTDDAKLDRIMAALTKAGLVIASKSEDITEWQPIETAPRDGTEIILYHPPETFEGENYPARVTAGQWIEWTDTTPEYHASTGVYLGHSIQGGGSMWMSQDGGFRDDSPPTKWQPLPDPPKEQAA